MRISGWGRYPVIDAQQRAPLTVSALQACLDGSFTGIARGMGRSYGDSALAADVLSTAHLNHILAFDDQTGILHAQAGVTLADVLRTFAPRGWFPPVTPGTKYVTLGGCVASDVHGKNHHLVGSFCDHVLGLTVMLADGEVVACSAQDNAELFHTTCGGMGLTGIILEVTFRMKPVNSLYIRNDTHKAADLESALALFEQHAASTYSVAWIDTLATGTRRGRSLVMVGEHADDGRLQVPETRPLAVPADMPSFLLNRYSIAAFNALYYHRIRKPLLSQRVHYEQYFYPLDKLLQWNRLYGKRGFTQYQCVIPTEAGRQGVAAILERMAASGRGSFLAVLKAFGPGNGHYLSFPMKGYTLAVDFKLDNGLLPFLDELDHIVLDHGGRLYLTKDARMNEQTFKRSYPRWEIFREQRAATGADRRFQSLQSTRLGI